MNRSNSAIAAALSLTAALAISPAQAQAPSPDDAPAPTVVQPAVDGIFEAFETHPLVGLDHLAPEDFLIALVRDPRFAREVGNVVLEGGASIHQDVVDRYVAGEDVSYAELRAISGDAIGAAVGGPGSPAFLPAVRAINAALPPDGRIRIRLGEPPLDWSTAGPGDVMGAMMARDSHAASVVLENILANGDKALVFYGGFHLATSFMGQPMLRGRVEADHPGAFFVVLPYSFIHQPAACAPLLERAEELWPTPALAAPARGGAPDPQMRECATLDGADLLARGLLSLSGGEPPVVEADAVLFLRPLGPLDLGLPRPDAFLDTEYRRELARRSRIGGPALPQFAEDLSLRKADYEIDLDASGYAERLDAMFAEHDKNGDGIVTSEEYVDPVPPDERGGGFALAPPPGAQGGPLASEP